MQEGGQVLKKAMAYLEGTIRSASSLLGMLMGSLVFVMATITAYEVVMRYAFNHPSVWVLEYSKFMLLLVVFLGAAYTQFQRGHVRVDILYNFLGQKAGALLNLATSLLALVFCVFLTWATWHEALVMFKGDFRSDSILKTPLGPVQTALAIGVSLLCLVIIIHIIQYIVALSTRVPKAKPSQKGLEGL